MDYAKELITRAFAPNAETCGEVRRDFEWVAKNIQSCLNAFHLRCAGTLIELFGEKHERPDLVEDLATIHYIKSVMLAIP